MHVSHGVWHVLRAPYWLLKKEKEREREKGRCRNQGPNL